MKLIVKKKLRLIVFSLFVLMASSAAYAKTLVIIVDVNCPVCRELHLVDAQLQNLAKKAQIPIVYAPIPADADLQNAWAEKTYYACYKDPSCQENKLLSVLYEAQDFSPLDTHSDVDMWLDFKFPGLKMHKYLNDADNHKSSLENTLRLASKVGLVQFPTFAIIDSSNNEIYQIATTGKDLTTRVKALNDFLNSEVKK